MTADQSAHESATTPSDIDHRHISKAALYVIRQLQNAGYVAYLVGGAVRDLLLQRWPKDFDIATDATPEQVKAVFGRNCRLIGRRFRLAHVYRDQECIEVATFRGGDETSQQSSRTQLSHTGRILRDNQFGNEREDAVRRDFRINALFYDVTNRNVIDYVDGLEDIHQKQLRLIGDPVTRYREDPVRMIRAVRFAASRQLAIDPQTASCLPDLAHLLHDVPGARLFDEFCKIMYSGFIFEATRLLVQHGLWQHLFPDVQASQDTAGNLQTSQMLLHGLQNTDTRVNSGLAVAPGFLFAVLLWPTLCKSLNHYQERGKNDYEALMLASDDTAYDIPRPVAVPRRVAAMSRDIWIMQRRFHRTRGKRAARFMQERRFRAAYDFLLLRADENPELQPLADWWTTLQALDGPDQEQSIRKGFEGTTPDDIVMRRKQS